MKLLSAILVLTLLFACSRAPETVFETSPPDARKDEQYKKDLEDIKKGINNEVKIKLKKDGKGDFYSWEISGKDANAVLKANETLSKKLDAGK